MKILRYEFNVGLDRAPVLVTKFLPRSEENEEIAKAEAYNGEYTIEDDGVEETVEPTPEERIQELEEALALLLSGVTE